VSPCCLSLLFPSSSSLLQTKGVKSIVSIKPTDAAWYSAVAGVGAGLLGTLAVWPFMRKLVRQYDDEQNSLPKDVQAADYKTSGIEEDRCAPVCCLCADLGVLSVFHKQQQHLSMLPAQPLVLTSSVCFPAVLLCLSCTQLPEGCFPEACPHPG
jgi:hypothetical protein